MIEGRVIEGPTRLWIKKREILHVIRVKGSRGLKSDEEQERAWSFNKSCADRTKWSIL